MKQTISGKLSVLNKQRANRHERVVPDVTDDIKLLWNLNGNKFWDHEYEPISKEDDKKTAEIKKLAVSPGSPNLKHSGSETCKIDKSTSKNRSNFIQSSCDPARSAYPSSDAPQSGNHSSNDNAKSGLIEGTIQLEELMQNKLGQLEHHMQQVRKDFNIIKTDGELSTVLLKLRNELLLNLKTKLPFPREVWSCRGESDYCHVITVCVGCNLNFMNNIADYIGNCLKKDSVLFYPSLNDLRRYSMAQREAHICLHKLDHLCSALMIRDSANYSQMLVQERKGLHPILQFIGSAGKKNVQDCNSEKTKNVLSFGSIVMPEMTENSHTIAKEWLSKEFLWKNEIDLSIEQDRGTWDNGLGCFAVERIQSERNSIHTSDVPFHIPQPEDLNKLFRHCFRLYWSCAQTPSPKRWTVDAENTGNEVLGFLTLSVPVVACTGVHTVGGIHEVLASCGV